MIAGGNPCNRCFCVSYSTMARLRGSRNPAHHSGHCLLTLLFPVDLYFCLTPFCFFFVRVRLYSPSPEGSEGCLV